MNRIRKIAKIAYENNYVFFYTAILMLVFAKSLGFYSGDAEYKIMMLLSLFLLGIKLLFTRYSVREFIIIAALLLYSAVIYLYTGYVTFTISVVTLCAMKDINVRELLHKILFVKVICTAVLVTASAMGVIDNRIKDQYAQGLTYAFGYQSPNEFMVNIFIIVVLIFFLYYERLNILHYLLSAFAFYATYSATKSTTGMLLGFMFIAAIICLKIFDRLGKFGHYFKRIISAMVIPTSLWCFLGTMAASIYFDVNNKFMFMIDQMITGRLKIQHQYWLNYGFSVFGKDISKAAARFDGVQINNGILDNNYLCSFYKYGVVTELLFIAFLVAGSYYYHRKKEYNAVIIINLICLYGLMEDFLISSVVNPMLFLVGIGVYELIKGNKAGAGTGVASSGEVRA